MINSNEEDMFCRGEYNVGGRCCNARGAEECEFCKIIRHKVSGRIIMTLCKINNKKSP